MSQQQQLQNSPNRNGLLVRIAGAVCFLGMIAATPAQAEIDLALPGGGGNFNYQAKSLLDMRFKNVVRQKYDYSCGSAALATLLKHYYGIHTNEKEILISMYETGDQKKIHKEGFSLLDIKNYLSSIDLQASGYRSSLDKLRDVSIPAIVLINKRGYQHFVVVKGVTEKRVLVGDPAQGSLVYARREFEDMWNGILFVIDSRKGFARQTFNTVASWDGKDKPYYERALANADLARFTLSHIQSPNFY